MTQDSFLLGVSSTVEVGSPCTLGNQIFRYHSKKKGHCGGGDGVELVL